MLKFERSISPFPSYLSYSVFMTVLCLSQSTSATVYSNCKTNEQIEYGCFQNFTKSTQLNEDISENTEVKNLALSQNLRQLGSNEQLSDHIDDAPSVESLNQKPSYFISNYDDNVLEYEPIFAWKIKQSSWHKSQSKMIKWQDLETKDQEVILQAIPSTNESLLSPIQWQDLQPLQTHHHSDLISQHNFNNSEAYFLFSSLEKQGQNTPSEERIELNNNLSASASIDPELGTLLLQEIKPNAIPKPEKPWIYLIANFGYLRSNNIFSSSSPNLVIDDDLFRTGITLLTFPSLSEQTSLLASVGGTFVSYANQSAFDYDQLNLNVGLVHHFNDNLSGQIGWKNRQLFDSGDNNLINDGTRFLNDHSFYIGLINQTNLTENLSFHSSYQFQSNFSEPQSRSQLINSFNLGLDYQFNPQLKAGLNYQLILSNFTEQDRDDIYHELMSNLVYTLSPNVSFEMFLGHSFGDSSKSSLNIDYDSFIFGLGMNVYLF